MSTISNSINLSGIGVHSGKLANIILHPRDQIGVQIRCGKSILDCTIENYVSAKRTSAIRGSEFDLECPEHLFGALLLAGIDGIVIEIPQSRMELPSKPIENDYIELLTSTECIHQATFLNRQSFPFYSSEGLRRYTITPESNSSSRVTKTFGESRHTVTINNEEHRSCSKLKDEIGKSRTFVDQSRLNELQSQGLCKGVSKDNCLFISDKEELPDHVMRECTLHKLLDFLGDIYLSGPHLDFSYDIVNPSHRLNIAFARHRANAEVIESTL